MDMLNLATMPFIILVVYVITYILKLIVFKTDSQRKAIPPVAAVIGGLIAIALFIFAPDTMSSGNIVEACTTGMASGLAAVGCNQVYKQFKKFTTVDDNSSEDNI